MISNKTSGAKTVSLSPAQVNEQLQRLLNQTAAAQNYELEKKTRETFGLIRRIESMLPQSDQGLSNYYLLFNAWIRWLSDWDHYSANLLHRRRLIGYLTRQLGQNRFSLEIYPYPTRLYNVRPEGTVVSIQVHECLDHMTDEECRNFAQFVRSHRWRDLKKLIAAYQVNNPHYQEILAVFRKTRSNPTHKNQTKGKYYDLETVFLACNLRYFGGKMSRPAIIHWSARVNHSTMGSYNINEDTLMINRGLDRHDIPPYVLDFVMYHELLHKALGVKTSGTRRLAHTKEFRELEMKHPDYERVQDFLKKNASKL